MKIREKMLLLFFSSLFFGFVTASDQGRLYSQEEVVEMLQAARSHINILEEHIEKQHGVITTLAQMLDRVYEQGMQVQVGTAGDERNS